jgi:hypothetical protein
MSRLLAVLPALPASVENAWRQFAESWEGNWIFRFDFTRWSVGGKVVFICSCVAVLTFLFPWVDVGIATRNGLEQGTFLLFAFYAYPLLMLLYNKKAFKPVSVACGLIAAFLTLLYSFSKTGELLERTVNATGIGAYLFLLNSLIVAGGAGAYIPMPDDKAPPATNPPPG